MSDIPEVRKALSEAIAWMIEPSAIVAYRECKVCGNTWWGRHPLHPGRENPRPETHNLRCPVPRWRAALFAETTPEDLR